jgi:transposase
LKISVVSLLLLIKLFELEISARKASTQLDISYPTTLKAFDLFRRSIACNLAKDDNLLKGEIDADESYFGGRRKGKRGRGAGHKTIVFGILERGGKVSVCILTNVKAESLIDETVKKVRRGSIVYTDKWCGYVLSCSADTGISILTTSTSSNKERCTSTGLKDSGPLLKNVS